MSTWSQSTRPVPLAFPSCKNYAEAEAASTGWQAAQWVENPGLLMIPVPQGWTRHPGSRVSTTGLPLTLAPEFLANADCWCEAPPKVLSPIASLTFSRKIMRTISMFCTSQQLGTNTLDKHHHIITFGLSNFMHQGSAPLLHRWGRRRVTHSHWAPKWQSWERNPISWCWSSPP